MHAAPEPASPPPSGLLGILRSWLQPGSSAASPSRAGHRIEAAGPSAQPSCALRVLVVDDNPANLMEISMLMRARGVVPFLAADGAEAVALACELPFDLILMDLQMPILDGLGASAAIRRFEATTSRPPVPVVAYTSSAPGATLLALYGINGSLSKPCEDQDLEDCLVQWCPNYRSAPTARGSSAAFVKLTRYR